MNPRVARPDRRRARLVAGLVALAVLVHLPALAAPFMLDDWAQAAMVEGRFVSPRTAFDLYDYIDDGNRRALFDCGAIPWWTHPNLVVRFLRPLPSALRWADARVFGRHAAWMHVHSLLWWALAVLGVHALLRRCFRPRAAYLGTGIFAFAPCHVTPLLWLANREVLVSTALGVWGLVSYLRWRSAARARDGVAAFLLFCAAALAGEYTLGFAGYVLAIEAVRGREPLARRALGLSAFAAPLVAYLAWHAALGYDAHGSGFYRSPIHHFVAYAHGAPRRLAILLASAWWGTDDTWTSASAWSLAAVGVGTVALLALPLAHVLRRLDVEERKPATWLLLGSFLSLAPVLSVEASVRLLGVSMVGVSAAVGVVLDRTWFPSHPEPRRGVAELTALVALVLSFAHLVRGPVDTCLLTKSTIERAIDYGHRVAWLRKHARKPKTTVMVLRGDSPETVLWAPMMLGAGAPGRWRVLTFGSGRSLLLRTGERTFEIVASDNPLFPVGPEDLFRSTDGVQTGEAVRLPGMRVTVLEVDADKRPRRLRFEMDRSLDDPSFEWIAEGGDGFREETIPPVHYGQPILP